MIYIVARPKKNKKFYTSCKQLFACMYSLEEQPKIVFELASMKQSTCIFERAIMFLDFKSVQGFSAHLWRTFFFLNIFATRSK